MELRCNEVTRYSLVGEGGGKYAAPYSAHKSNLVRTRSGSCRSAAPPIITRVYHHASSELTLICDRSTTHYRFYNKTCARDCHHVVCGNLSFTVFTFRLRRSRGEMYTSHARLCVCMCVCVSDPRRIPTLLHGPGCNLGEW